MRIFSCVCWPHICLLLKSVCSCPSPTFGWVCLFSSCKFVLVICRFWLLALCQMGRLQNVFSILWLLGHSNECFFCCTEALEFNQIPLIYFGFCCQCFWCFSHEVLAYAYFLNGTAQVLFQSSLWCQVLCLSLYPSGVNFSVRCQEGVQFLLSPHCQPVFPTQFIKQGILSLLLVFVRLVKDQMVVHVWHCIPGLCSVLLVYISVLVPEPCCFDYCSLVVQFEVRQRDGSSFVLFAQDCLGYLGLSFGFIQSLRWFSPVVKKVIGSLMGITLNL